MLQWRGRANKLAVRERETSFLFFIFLELADSDQGLTLLSPRPLLTVQKIIYGSNQSNWIGNIYTKDAGCSAGCLAGSFLLRFFPVPSRTLRPARSQHMPGELLPQRYSSVGGSRS